MTQQVEDSTVGKKGSEDGTKTEPGDISTKEDKANHIRIKNERTGIKGNTSGKMSGRNSRVNSETPVPVTGDSRSSPSQSPAPASTQKTGVPRKRRAKKIACTECRQQKARCDAFERAPEPCTRCAKRGIPCVMDSDYKRTFKRVQIARMERDYEMMKRRFQYTMPILGGVPGRVPGMVGPVPVPPFSGVRGPQILPGPTQQAQYLPPLPHMMSQSPQSPQPIIYPRVARTATTPSSSTSTPGTIKGSAPTYTPRAVAGAVPLVARTGSSSFTSVARTPQVVPVLPPVGTPGKTPVRAPSVEPVGSPVGMPAVASSAVVSPAVVSPAPVPSPALCPRTLGDVTLTAPQITELFRHFVHYYQPLLPVVDVAHSIDSIYRLCPILFWTVMFTALRGFDSPGLTRETGRQLYFALAPTLKSALAELSIAPITRYAPTELDEPVLNVCSVYTVQAFLLYTFWPPLTSSVSADSSWYTIGIALFQAIRIGLHLPGHSADGLRTNNPSLLAEQVRTWICCNIVSQTIATAFGFPGLNRLDLPAGRIGSSIPKKDKPASNPIHQMFEIQRFEAQAAQTLNSNAFDPLMLVDTSERYPLLKLLESELDQLQLRLSSKGMDDFRLLSLYAARLHLTTYYFLDTAKVAGDDLSRGLVKAYSAAVCYITHCRDAQRRNRAFACHLPSAYTLTIWQAACIVARLLHSPYSALFDARKGRQVYSYAVSLAHQASIIRHDMAYRASGIMRSMWALFKTLNEQHALSPRVVVRSRMSASVFFDSLWIVRQKCGMIRLRPEQREKAEREAQEAGDSESDSSDNEVTVNTTGNGVGITHTTEAIRGNTTATPTTPHFSIKPTRKKHRSLSETLHPESDVRKIISTIPLDPQPISLSEKGESGSSSHSSPFVYRSPVEKRRKLADGKSAGSTPGQHTPHTTTPQSNTQSDNPLLSLESWDLTKEIDSDLLFKDIDTVMNDFGFHAE